MSAAFTLVVVAFVVAFAIGLALFVFGSIVALTTALGNKHWLWAVGMLVFFPLSIAYCLAHPSETAWPKGLILKGLAAFVFCVAIGGIAFSAGLLKSSETTQKAQTPK